MVNGYYFWRVRLFIRLPHRQARLIVRAARSAASSWLFPYIFKTRDMKIDENMKLMMVWVASWPEASKNSIHINLHSGKRKRLESQKNNSEREKKIKKKKDFLQLFWDAFHLDGETKQWLHDVTIARMGRIAEEAVSFFIKHGKILIALIRRATEKWILLKR